MNMKKSKKSIGVEKSSKFTGIFQEKHGYAKTTELRERGIHQRDLKKAVDDGRVIKIKSGLYRYGETPMISHQGFVDVSLSVPHGVICLISALDYYELTTFNPTFIFVALPRNTWRPKIEYPPVEFFHFSKKQFEAGIDEVKIEGFNIRIYCPEKTVCDCFRYRNKLGLDIAKEGLAGYLRRKDRSLEKLLEYAEICRIKSLMQTWLDALV
jgi:predicted transcriptional regulator of viral defense system